MKLTQQAIIDLLPLVADQGWHRDDGNMIRNARGVCPICAIVNELQGNDLWAVAAQRALVSLAPEAEVPSEVVSSFILAADFAGGSTRRKILAALGLGDQA